MTTKLILKNPTITVNGVNLSDHVGNVTITMKKKLVDSTNFSGGGGMEQLAGLMQDEFQVEFHQDFSNAEVHQTLNPLYQNNTEFTVVVVPVNASVSATNPSFTGTCILAEYAALAGNPGDLAKVKVTFPTQRTGITVAIS